MFLLGLEILNLSSELELLVLFPDGDDINDLGNELWAFLSSLGPVTLFPFGHTYFKENSWLGSKLNYPPHE